MIYLNNAATSFPKPSSVIHSMTVALESPPISPLRSNISQQGDMLTDLRRQLGTLFNIRDHERIFICSSATDAINRILGGKEWTVVATSDNHNSVLRPLLNGHHPVRIISPSSVFDTLPNGSLLILNHCSNVTGKIIDVPSIVRQAHQQGCLVMLDASQSAGCIPIDIDRWGIDILVFTGHKSLFGPTGTGGYYVHRAINLRPTQFGGTGRDSSIIKYENDEWEYEVGTQNMVGLAGLKAGVEYVLGRGVGCIFHRLQSETNRLIHELRSIEKVILYSEGGKRQGPVISFNIEGLLPSDVGYILQNSYDMTVRTGLHCSPLTHQQLGTWEHGTVRVSLSDFTTHEELETFIYAIREITGSL
ncbi:MAG: aminotransferase class V-fold PLP-dependent enzyme [Prevotella sp.]|nr:aminotransferase class V-fold PLP-dependent enzyme [Prevotella sp.]